MGQASSCRLERQSTDITHTGRAVGGIWTHSCHLLLFLLPLLISTEEGLFCREVRYRTGMRNEWHAPAAVGMKHEVFSLQPASGQGDTW